MLALPTTKAGDARRRPDAFPTLTDDPLGFRAGDANLYRFVRNSAVNAVDPSGLVQQGNPLDGLAGGSGGGRDALRTIDPLATFANATPILAGGNLSTAPVWGTTTLVSPSFGGGTSLWGSANVTVQGSAQAGSSSIEVGVDLARPRNVNAGRSERSGFGQSLIEVGLGLTRVDNYFSAAIGVGLAADLAIPAPAGGFGHHWVPDAVVRQNIQLLGAGAQEVFERGFTGALPYNHGFDTWGTDQWGRTTHRRYNQAVGVLLQSRAASSPSGKISRSAAEEVVTFLETGVYNQRGKLSTVLRRNADAAETITRWRTGFHQGLAAAQHALLESQRSGAVLSRNQLKAIAQREVNGANTPAFRAHYDDAARRFHAGFQNLSAAARSRLVLKAVGRSLGAVSAFYLASAARRGFAGDNPEQWAGFAGAYAGLSAELAQKEVVEAAVQGAARGIFNGIFDFENQQQRMRERFDEHLPASQRNSAARARD